MDLRPYQSEAAACIEKGWAEFLRQLLVLPTGLAGMQFGRLTVLGPADVAPGRGRYWRCQCSCGNTCERSTSRLLDRAKREKSCGCAHKESIARAHAAAIRKTTRFSHPYKVRLKWLLGNMIKRCHRPGTNRYERYGARGIKVCEEWRQNHTAFYEWAIANGYRPGLWIERVDFDGDYCPENCRFATPVEQANNTSRNRFLTWRGQTMTVSQWARSLGVPTRALRHRIDRGWPTDRALEQPFRRAA